MKVLEGKQILVTRPVHQAENLVMLLESAGATAIRLPTIAIEEQANNRHIKATLANISQFDWVIFISANAVNFALHANGGKIPGLNDVRVVAIGKASANALKIQGIAVSLSPENGFSSETLLVSRSLQDIKGQRFLIVRGEGGRELLAMTLRDRGAHVEYLEVYRRVVPAIDCSAVALMLAKNKLNVITVSSGEILQNLLFMLGEKTHAALRELPLVVVSDRVRQIAANMGFKRIIMAKNPSDLAIIEAVITSVTGELSGRIE